MADSTISQLPTALSVSGVDYFPVDQGGITKKATLAQLGNGAVFLAPGKTLTVNASLTFNGTDATTFTFPSTSATLARTDAAQSFAGLQTFTNGITTPAQITSTIATGTAPFVVASTTPVANLSIGGNAATSSVAAVATILQTARTIDGVSFDGSANILVVAPATHAATNKATPVDADEFTIWDSVSGLLNHVTWANIKATAKTYFDTIYAAIAGSASQVFSVGTATSPAHAVRLDQMPQFPYRNRLINGDILVSQVNGTTAVTPTVTDTYPFDQWKVDATQASKLTFQQVADAPTGLKYSVKILVAAQFSPGAADRFGIYQPVEGQNIIDMQFGLATAQTVALSLWIKGSVAGTYACGVNNVGTRSYVGTIAVTTSWVRQTVVLVADTTGTWATDNTVGAQFYIDLGSGSNFNTTAGAWQAGDFTRTTGTVTFVNQVNGSTLNFTGAQFEAIPTGSVVATSFEMLPYETQLRRCQRYLPCWNSVSATSGLGAAYTSTTTNAAASLPFPVPTRVAPTALVVSNATHLTFSSAANFTSSAVTFSVVTSTTNGNFGFTITGGTASQGGIVFFNNSAGQLYFTGAQL